MTPASVTVTNVELKLYGASSKEIQLTGVDGDENNPTHVWTGLCTTPCGLALRDKARYVDLTGLARIRWNVKTSGFHEIRPIVKLADGTWLVGDHADASPLDWLVWRAVDRERSLAQARWRAARDHRQLRRQARLEQGRRGRLRRPDARERAWAGRLVRRRADRGLRQARAALTGYSVELGRAIHETPSRADQTRRDHVQRADLAEAARAGGQPLRATARQHRRRRAAPNRVRRHHAGAPRAGRGSRASSICSRSPSTARGGTCISSSSTTSRRERQRRAGVDHNATRVTAGLLCIPQPAKFQ